MEPSVVMVVREATLMDLVLVRHGAREVCDESGRLTVRGRHQIDLLADALRRRGVVPDHYLTSGSPHAVESADRLIERLSPGRTSVVLDAVTPGRGPGRIDDVISEAEKALELTPVGTLILVGHEGRLSDLLTEMTGARHHPFAPGGAVCLRAESLDDMVAGRGRVHFRYPTVDHQEETLRTKVQSKMTVATFLAGFVFTALSALLLLDRDQWPWHRVIAATTLTASIALFVASVYIYDQLGTPAGFWTDGDKPRPPWRLLYAWRDRRMEKHWTRSFEHPSGIASEEAARLSAGERARRADDEKRFFRPVHDGLVYWHMVKVSRFIFTPAVVLALAGFVALLVGTGDWRIWAGGCLGLLLAGGYAALHRPSLGAD